MENKNYSEEEFLLISGIQHFSFCRRQWALIHIEQLWNENGLTAEGRVMEEIRTVFAERFVISLINNRIISGKDFTYQDNGVVILDDNAKQRFLSEWQKRKKDEITHPFLGEKIPWGLVPYVITDKGYRIQYLSVMLTQHSWCS